MKVRRSLRFPGPFGLGKPSDPRTIRTHHGEPKLPKATRSPGRSIFEHTSLCKKLNETQKTPPGYEWRFPTEAEWEYACRAGSGGPFAEVNQANCRLKKTPMANTLANSDGLVHLVGRPTLLVERNQMPSAYDMHGRLGMVLHAVKPQQASFMSDRKTGTIDPFSQEGEWRALRGGNFEVPHSRCRSAYRGANAPTVTNSDRFRLALAPVLGVEGNSTGINADKDKKIENLPGLETYSRRSFLMEAQARSPYQSHYH